MTGIISCIDIKHASNKFVTLTPFLLPSFSFSVLLANPFDSPFNPFSPGNLPLHACVCVEGGGGGCRRVGGCGCVWVGGGGGCVGAHIMEVGSTVGGTRLVKRNLHTL